MKFIRRWRSRKKLPWHEKIAYYGEDEQDGRRGWIEFNLLIS